MKRRTSLLITAGGLALAGGLAAAVVFGGVLNVAATEAEPELLQWLLSTTMRSSVENHASDIVVPGDVDLHDPALAERAFGHYSVACTPCHGAPGVDPAPWLVLDPPAESLAETAERWSDAELYWIVKHGVKMTGMPALGPTHQDRDLWAIAAFVRQLPEMTSEQYQQMAARQEAALSGHEGHGMSAAGQRPSVVAPAAIEAASGPAPATETVQERVHGVASTTNAKAKRSPRKPRRAQTQSLPVDAPAEPPVATPAERPADHEHSHHH